MTKMWLKTIGLYQAIAISFVCQIDKKRDCYVVCYRPYYHVCKVNRYKIHHSFYNIRDFNSLFHMIFYKVLLTVDFF